MYHNEPLKDCEAQIENEADKWNTIVQSQY